MWSIVLLCDIYVFNKIPAQWSIKSDTFYTDVNSGERHSDKNQSGALAHISKSFWFESSVDFYHAAVAMRRLPWSFHILRGKGRWGQMEVWGQASRLNTLSGIKGLWGRWRKSSLANVSLSSSVNTHMLSHTGMHTHIAFTLLLLANMGWYKDLSDTVSAQISPSLSVTGHRGRTTCLIETFSWRHRDENKKYLWLQIISFFSFCQSWLIWHLFECLLALWLIIQDSTLKALCGNSGIITELIRWMNRNSH